MTASVGEGVDTGTLTHCCWGCDMMQLRGDPRWHGGKNPPVKAGDTKDAGSIPGSGRSPGGGNGNPLQLFGLGNPMDRGAWRVIIHGVTKGRTRLSAVTRSCFGELFGSSLGC